MDTPTHFEVIAQDSVTYFGHAFIYTLAELQPGELPPIARPRYHQYSQPIRSLGNAPRGGRESGNPRAQVACLGLRAVPYGRYKWSQGQMGRLDSRLKIFTPAPVSCGILRVIPESGVRMI